MKMGKILYTGVAIAVLLLLTGCPTPNDPTPTAVTFESAVQTGGTSETADSTGLTMTFSVDPTTLAASDITVTGAIKGELSGSGTTRSLAISDVTVDNGETVSVAIASPSGFTISSSPQTAVVHKIVYKLRDTGPAGGLIFYDKGSYSEGWRYLEAAPASSEWTSKQWGKIGIPVMEAGVTGTAIGTGENNTVLIVSVLNAAPADSDRAAQLCNGLEHTYNGTTYNDWFLPSKDELFQMYENLKVPGVGEFSVDITYWSSSERTIDWAFSFWFSNGTFVDHAPKDYSMRVRAVRAF